MQRLLTRLSWIGILNWFSHTSCQERLHPIHSALTIWHCHGLKSCVLFVDLKAFDIQHEVLYKILNKYGPPSSLKNVICSNCTVNISLGKETRDVPYKIGVHKGDNMAPLLFLFVMQAIMETLETHLPTACPQYRYIPNHKGQLPFSSELCTICLWWSFPPSKQKWHQSRCTNHLLLFHPLQPTDAYYGTDDTKSKMEAMHFPPTLNEANKLTKLPVNCILNNGTNNIPFVRSSNTLVHSLPPPN